jgi:hypothetical protein
VLLFNKKKRALHDYMAGTVVICKPFTFVEIKELFGKKVTDNTIIK